VNLTDLNPRWIDAPDRQGLGVTFDCPCCVGTARAVRIAVVFTNPLDGGEPVPLTPRVLWPLLWPKDGEPRVTTAPPGTHWQREGGDFETLTLHPSVDGSASGHWHGFLRGGGIQ